MALACRIAPEISYKVIPACPGKSWVSYSLGATSSRVEHASADALLKILVSSELWRMSKRGTEGIRKTENERGKYEIAPE